MLALITAKRIHPLDPCSFALGMQVSLVFIGAEAGWRHLFTNAISEQQFSCIQLYTSTERFPYECYCTAQNICDVRPLQQTQVYRGRARPYSCLFSNKGRAQLAHHISCSRRSCGGGLPEATLRLSGAICWSDPGET